MNFYEKSLIYNYSKLYDINFPQKIGFLWFFLRKFLLTVFNIIYGEYYFFNVQSFKYEFLWKILDIKKYNIVRNIDFPQKIGFLPFFLRKFLLTVFHIIYGEFYFFYCPKFQIWILMKNPWYTIIQHCTTLIFHKKLDFCDFF